MQRDRTDWTGVAFGISLACLIAFQQFKLPPVLPGMIAAYGWDRTLAGGFMAVYALAGLAFPAAGLVVLLARGLEGVAFAVGAIAGPALASRSAAPRDLGFVVGLMAAWIPTGQLLATGFALILPSWQWIWLLGMAVTLLLGLWAVQLRHHDAFAVPGK